MTAVFAPLPKMIGSYELASGDLIVTAQGELAFFLTVPDEYRIRQSRCAFSLSTFKLATFDEAYAGFVTRDYVVAIDPARGAPSDASLVGGEVAIAVGDEVPLFVTSSGESVGVDLTGNKSFVSRGRAAIFPHWTISVADGFGGRREVYAR